MTAMVTFQPSDIDRSKADDQMDLVSSPTIQNGDIDIDLNDAAEASAEDDQDFMHEDGHQQPADSSGPASAKIQENVDEDLMVDEETAIIDGEPDDVPDLSMDNQQDDPNMHEAEEDILFDEEEELGEQDVDLLDGVEEVQMADGVRYDEDQGQATQLSSVTSDEHTEQEIDAREDVALLGLTETSVAPLHQPSDSAVANSDAQVDAVSGLQDGVINILQRGSSADAQKEVLGHGVRHLDQTDVLGIDNSSTSLGAEEDLIASRTPAGADANNASTVPGILAASPYINHKSSANTGPPDEEKLGDLPSAIDSLHTVRVYYLNTEMRLFPSTDEEQSDVFFLQDTSLALATLDKMLCACRDVLADTIGDDDELVLDVASLGLHISEDSRYAAQISLAQILDVYTLLARNENIQQAEPLICTLSSRVCLASQYAYLNSVAKEGKTLTQIAEETAYTPGEDEEDGPAYTDKPAHDEGETYEAQDTSVPVQDADDIVQVSEQEAITTGKSHEPVQIEDALTEAITENDNSQPVESSTKVEKGKSFENGDGLQTPVSGHKQQSSISTVEGGFKESELDDDTFDICLKPGPCSCLSCVAETASAADQAPEQLGPGNSTEGILGNGEYRQDEFHLPALHDAAHSDAAQLQDTESYKEQPTTTQAEEDNGNLFEEDLFSQDQQQVPEHNASAEIQQGDEEDLGLEEHQTLHQNLEDQEGFNLGTATSENHNSQENDVLSKSGALGNDTLAQVQASESVEAEPDADDQDDLLDLEDHDEKQIQEEVIELTEVSISGHDGEEDITVADTAEDQEPGTHGDAPENHADSTNSNGKDSLPKEQTPRSSASPLLGPIDQSLAGTPKAGPKKQQDDRTGSKRKAVEEEEEDFDLFDLGTPDNKRRRPS